MTSTLAKLVCRRLLASNGEMRTSRCTPRSALAEAVGVLAFNSKRDALEPGAVAGQRVGDLHFPAAASNQRWYMRRKHLRPVLRCRLLPLLF